MEVGRGEMDAENAFVLVPAKPGFLASLGMTKGESYLWHVQLKKAHSWMLS